MVDLMKGNRGDDPNAPGVRPSNNFALSQGEKRDETMPLKEPPFNEDLYEMLRFYR